jgi:hypothetical protein
LKLKPFPKFEKDATMTQLWNWDHSATTIRICHILLISMTMYYHTSGGNRQLSKPKNHFVHHLEPWECNFCTIHFVMGNTKELILRWHSNLQVWYKLLHNQIHSHLFIIFYFITLLLNFFSRIKK